MEKESLLEIRTFIRRYEGTMTGQPIQFVHAFCMVRDMYAEIARLEELPGIVIPRANCKTCGGTGKKVTGNE